MSDLNKILRTTVDFFTGLLLACGASEEPPSRKDDPHVTPPPAGPRLVRRSLSASLSLALAAAGTAAAVVLAGAPPAQAAAVPAPSPVGISGRGATVPFKEQEAEYAATNGSLIGPDRLYGSLPSEASGRQAVTLDSAGEYVEFTLTAPANAMTFRYSLPDNAAGTGRDASSTSVSTAPR